MNGKFIGGGDDMVRLVREGEFRKMAIDAGMIEAVAVKKLSSNVRYFVNGKRVTHEKFDSHVAFDDHERTMH